MTGDEPKTSATPWLLSVKPTYPNPSGPDPGRATGQVVPASRVTRSGMSWPARNTADAVAASDSIEPAAPGGHRPGARAAARLGEGGGAGGGGVGGVPGGRLGAGRPPAPPPRGLHGGRRRYRGDPLPGGTSVVRRVQHSGGAARILGDQRR